MLNLSENVRRSLEYKRRNGEWGGKAPLGYLNERDANNKSALVHDPERAFLVRMLFEEYAKGCFSISGDLVQDGARVGAEEQDPQGWHLSASQIQHILMNPFYYGEMRIKGRLYPHSYPPLISRDLFDRCEEVRLGSRAPSATRYSEKPFVFRGLIKCAASGRTVTCDLKKGRHVYLICRDPADPAKKLFVPKSEVLKQVKAVFRSIQVPDKLLECAAGTHAGKPRGRNQFHREPSQGSGASTTRFGTGLPTLLDMRLDRSITQDEYDKKARELKERQTEIAVRIEQHQKGEASTAPRWKA